MGAEITRKRGEQVTTKKKKAAATPAPKKSGAGRPPVVMSEKEKRNALMMYIAGATREGIAKRFGCDYKTLMKNMGADLDELKAVQDSEVVGQLFQAIKKGNLTAIIFYLKTRCGWKEERIEREDSDKKQHVLVPTLSVEQWQNLVEQNKKAKAG